MSRRILTITVGGKTQNHELAAHRSVTFGRTPENDIVIDDKSISRRHATFHNADVLEVEDLGSHNGTYVLEVGGEANTETVSMTVHRRLEPHVRVAVVREAVIQIGAAIVTFDDGGEYRASTAPASVVVEDVAMQRLYGVAERAAGSDLPVLLLGESGVGKEVLARYVHERSARRALPMLSINCGAIAEHLLDAELFGYEKGAFTGALKTTPGLLESANGSTMFLDEVGELPPAFQVKLLRVLEVGQVIRVGARDPLSIDVRYVAATNRDLVAEIARGGFREDLYYRLNGISLTIPPLRERRHEVLALAEAFLAEEGSRRGMALRLSADARTLLVGYAWPGNVRQLRSVLRRAAVMSPRQVIEPEHIELAPPASQLREPAATPRDPTADALRDEAAEIEKRQILEALEASAGNQTRTAEILGITRRALVVRLDKYNLPRPRKGR